MTWIALAMTLSLTITIAPMALAAPPDRCDPWPSCKGVGGGGDDGGGGGGASYQFTASITGEYVDLVWGPRSFSVFIDSQTIKQGKVVDLALPQVFVSGLATDYAGPAIRATSQTGREQVSNYHYPTLALDFGDFVYSQTWESGSSNYFVTGKPFDKLKVGQSADVTSFDIFVAERRPWNGDLGAVDYDLFLRWRNAVSGTVTRISDTQWDLVFSIAISGELPGATVFQRHPWSDYENRILDVESDVAMNPSVTYTGTGTIVATVA